MSNGEIQEIHQGKVLVLLGRMFSLQLVRAMPVLHKVIPRDKAVIATNAIAEMVEFVRSTAL